MKASLVLKMGQNLTMTPQLQQAIRLLQMSTLDLQAEIQEALDSNPMLEVEDDNNSPASQAERATEQQINATQSNSGETQPDTQEQQVDSTDWTEQIPSELEIEIGRAHV